MIFKISIPTTDKKEISTNDKFFYLIALRICSPWYIDEEKCIDKRLPGFIRKKLMYECYISETSRNVNDSIYK